MIDTFRQEYRQLTENEKTQLKDIKQTAQGLHNLIDLYHGDPRCTALAKTKLEEAVFWATKGITG